MSFAGVNNWAVLVAAVAAWILGAAWYMTLSKPWIAAVGLTPEQMAANKQKPGASLPFIYAFASHAIMGFVLAGILGHLGPGQVTLRNGIISGAICWLGFVFTSMLVNNSFAGRDRRLLLIDGGHWLAVLMLMGAIIGAWGV